MKLTFVKKMAACSVLCIGWVIPGLAQSSSASSGTIAVSFSATIEAIEFKDVPQHQQRLVLQQIGVRVGDKLTAETRQRIGRELGKVRKGMTFSYKSGSVAGTAKLLISSDC